MKKNNFNVTRFFAAVVILEEGTETARLLCKWENAKANVDAYKDGARNIYFVNEGLDGLLEKQNTLAKMAINSLLKLNRKYHKETGLFFMGVIEDLSQVTDILETILDEIHDVIYQRAASEE